MATTYTAKSWFVPAVGANTFPGVIKRAYAVELSEATNDTSYAFIINDIIKVFALPPYVKILSGKMVTNGETDDHATPTVDLDLIVSDGTTTKTLVNGGTAMSEDNVTATTDFDADDAYMYVTPTDDFYVAIKAIAAAAGDAATGADITCEVEYTGLTEPGEISMRSGRDNTP